MTDFKAALAGLAIVMSAAGCDIEAGEPTRGEQGDATFELTESYGCGFLAACALDRPLALKTTEALLIKVDADEDEVGNLQVVSSQPSVLQITSSQALDFQGGGYREYQAGVLAAGTGDAEIQLVRPGGSVVDSVIVRVRQPTQLDYEMIVGDTSAPVVRAADGSFRVAIMASHSIVAKVFDDAGEGLYANDSVTWKRLSGPGELSHFFLSGDVIHEDRVFFTSPIAGTTRLEGSVGGMTIELDVHADILQP